MKKFAKHILKIIFILVVIAYALDFCYTYVYKNSPPQNKVQYLYSLKNRKIDYIFIGSSRVENSVIAAEIEKKTNKKTVNLGIKGLKLKDAYYIIKLLKEHNVSCRRIFIQVDYSFEIEEDYSKFFSYELVPFCNSSNLTVNEYLKSTNARYFIYKYIPFTKYMDSDELIGFRKIMSSLKNKPSDYNFSKGYEALYGCSSRELERIPNRVSKKNKYFAKINSFAKHENLDVTYFSAPVSPKSTSLPCFKGLKKVVIGLHDFHDVIPDQRYFYDDLHVNHNGALIFTKILIEKLNL